MWTLAKEFIPSYAEYERLEAGRAIPLLVFTEIDTTPVDRCLTRIRVGMPTALA